MRRLLPFLFCLAACNPVTAQVGFSTTPERAPVVMDAAKPLLDAARERLASSVVYDGRYVTLDYPGGDVPASIGVCTDVIIRSLRTAYDFDLQKAVH